MSTGKRVKKFIRTSLFQLCPQKTGPPQKEQTGKTKI